MSDFFNNAQKPIDGAKSHEDKQLELYLRQKKTLELFLERNAISKEQFDKSIGDLTEKMGMEKYR